MVEIGEEVFDAVDVRNDDEFDEADEQVGPSRSVVIQQVQQVTASLESKH